MIEVFELSNEDMIFILDKNDRMVCSDEHEFVENKTEIDKKCIEIFGKTNLDKDDRKYIINLLRFEHTKKILDIKIINIRIKTIC